VKIILPKNQPFQPGSGSDENDRRHPDHKRNPFPSHLNPLPETKHPLTRISFGFTKNIDAENLNVPNATSNAKDLDIIIQVFKYQQEIDRVDLRGKIVK